MIQNSDGLCCLLCGKRQLTVSDQLLGREIHQLWRAAGIEFPPEAISDIKKNASIVLWRCTGCNFEFFNPALAGNGLFYQCLESPDYYCPTRPEFARTVRFAVKAGLTNVLDIGCGTGDFLDQAHAAGLQTFGLELNPSAREKVRAKGHQVSDQLLQHLPMDFCPAGFDLITLFQVVEHVPDPVGILKEAAARLKPGGFISIAVPSKSGIYRLLPWDQAQWPPHHISRWCLNGFKTLASKANLRLVETGGDVLLGSAIEQTFRFRHQMAATLGKSAGSKIGFLPVLGSWFYRKTGMKYVAPKWGASIYAYFQKI